MRRKNQATRMAWMKIVIMIPVTKVETIKSDFLLSMELLKVNGRQCTPYTLSNQILAPSFSRPKHAHANASPPGHRPLHH